MPGWRCVGRASALGIVQAALFQLFPQEVAQVQLVQPILEDDQLAPLTACGLAVVAESLAVLDGREDHRALLSTGRDHEHLEKVHYMGYVEGALLKQDGRICEGHSCVRGLLHLVEFHLDVAVEGHQPGLHKAD